LNSAVFTSDEFIEKLSAYLDSTLTPHRYAHSVSCAYICKALAVKFGVDPKVAFFTGLVHDIAREYSDVELIRYAAGNGQPITDIYYASPMLLHGRSGAVVLQEKFGIDNRSVLDAIRTHTTGDAGMDSLAKILFVADYIEPRREHVTKEFYSSLKGLTLDDMVYTVLDGTLKHLAKKGKPVAPEALDLKRELEFAK